MKKSLMLLFLLCVGTVPVSSALAQGRSGNAGPPAGFPSVPTGPKFIVPGQGVGVMPAVAAPVPTGLPGISMGTAVPVSSAGGVAGGNMPAMSAVANGLPPQANGIGIPGGKHAVGVASSYGMGPGNVQDAVAAPAANSAMQAPSSPRSAKVEEHRAEANQYAGQVVPQRGSRPLPTCR